MDTKKEVPWLEPEVREMVAGIAESTLLRWLHSIGAPEAALTLANAVELYYHEDHWMQAEVLAETLNAVAVLGAKWGLNGETYTIERPAPGLGAPTGESQNAKLMRYVADAWPTLSDEAKQRIAKLVDIKPEGKPKSQTRKNGGAEKEGKPVHG
jgi:hypothetical protein